MYLLNETCACNHFSCQLQIKYKTDTCDGLCHVCYYFFHATKQPKPTPKASPIEFNRTYFQFSMYRICSLGSIGSDVLMLRSMASCYVNWLINMDVI